MFEILGAMTTAVSLWGLEGAPTDPRVGEVPERVAQAYTAALA